MSTTPSATPFGQDRSIDEAPVLTDEEEHIIRNKQAAMDKLFADAGKAKYKIEVVFTHKRKLHGLSMGILSILESGTQLHGGGDTKVYICPGKELGLSDCQSVIPDASVGYGHLVCPKCQHVWKGEEVIGEIMYNLDAWKWAKVLLKHYVRLNHNADIYLKYPRIDLREASRQEQEKQLMGEKLTKARSARINYTYPLANIIKDTSNGSDLLTRFHAFLTV